MPEYIDQEAYTRYLSSREAEFIDDYGKGWVAGIAAAKSTALKFKAADVALVRHARWVPKRKMYRTPNAKNHTCSECGLATAELWNFCPNCGAQMDGGISPEPTIR